MATGILDIYSSTFLERPFIQKPQPQEATPSVLPPDQNPKNNALIQRVQDITKALLETAVDEKTIPPSGEAVLQHHISTLHVKLRLPTQNNEKASATLSIGLFLAWLGKKIIAIATAIYKVVFAIFRKSPPEVTIEAILQELKLSQAISPAQYETVLQLASKEDKNPALILLTTLLGLSTSEMSPLLSFTLQTSPEYAFSLLLECYLIKRTASTSVFTAVMNNEDRACLSNISFDNLQSFDCIKEQLRCLRSLSYRSTIRSWICNLPGLLHIPTSPRFSRACTEALKNNDPKAFVAALSPLLTQIASRPTSNESLYAKELLSFVGSNFSFDAFAAEIRREKFLSQWTNQFYELKNAGKALIKAHKSSEAGISALKKAAEILSHELIRARYVPGGTPICATFGATQLGSLNRSLRKITSLAKRMAAELNLPESSAEDLKTSKHILHLATSCGGGHNGMVNGLNKSLESAASQSEYHFTSQSLDIPVQVTRPLDVVYKILHNFGLNIDTTRIYNFLLQHDLCSVIEFLKWITSGAPSEDAAEKKQALIRQAILTNDPDYLNMVYAFDGNDIDQVSQDLGLGLGYIATDLDLNDWNRLPTSPYFREAVPSLQHPEIRKTLKIPEEKVEEIGLSVGPQFETRLTPEQLDGVRARFNIKPNEKVVFFSNGGAALQNTIPERIALQYADTTTPIHLLVVCGKNEAFKSYLENKVMPYIPEGAPVKMTVLGFQQREQMAELSQLADVVIGKPGGMSTMEFIKSGSQVIFDESSYRLRWEKFNADVLVKSGRGMIMSSPDQILDLIRTALKNKRRPPMKLAETKASEKYVSFVTRLLNLANRPEAEQGWREKRRSWHKLNKHMMYSTIG